MTVNKGKTILLVEDNVIVALAEKATLEENGYAVMTAHAGEAAVAAARSTPGIDLVLMDIDLGRGMDGTEAAKRILEMRELPLVFLSSHIEPKIVEKTEGITSYGYIVKNSGETVLLTSIKMAFRLFEARMSEKKKTAALEKSEEKFRTLVENLNDIVYAVDLEGRFTYLSPGLGRISGYTADELIGRRFADLVYPDDLPVLLKEFEKVIAGGIEPHEFRVVDRDGSVRHMRTSSRLVTSAGAVTGVTGVMTDMTERRRAEEELVLKSLAIDQVKDFVTITDLDGTITYVNQAQVGLFGRPRHELVGKKTNVFGENAERGSTQREILEATLRDGAWRGEVINIAADGSEHVMDCQTQVVRDAAGTVIALCGISTDVTEHKKAEAALRVSEEQNRMIFENTNMGIFLSTLDGVYLKVNRAVLNISGYDSIEEFLSVPTSRLYADQADRQRIIGELRARGSVENMEIRAVKKDGSVHWISLNAVMLKDDEGAPKNIIGFVEDITDRKRTGQLIKAERDLGLLLAGAMSLTEAMRFSLSAAMSAGGMDSGGVYLVNETGGIDLVVHEGLSESFLSRVSHYDADSPSVRVLMRGEPVFVDDSGVYGGPGRMPSTDGLAPIMKNEGLKTVAVLPIRMRGEVLASMNISSHTSGTISQHARMALESIASSLGSAIAGLKMREALLDRESRFRGYFEMPLVGIAIISPGKGWIEVNGRLCEILGYTAEELKERTWMDLTHPDDVAADAELLKRVLAGEMDNYTMEKRYVRKNGDIVWGSLAVGCVRNNDGSVNHIVGMLNDITGRKRAEDLLKLSEEKFLRSFMNSPAVLCIARLKDFRIIDINDTFLRKSGLTREEVINKTAPELLVWDNPANREEAVKAVMTEGQITGKEYGFRNRDGSVLMGEYPAFIINIGGEKHILVTIIDITDRKRAEARIQALLEEKEMLIREVHHRIKNNMSTITSLLTLQSARPESREAAPALQDAVSRVRSMGVLYDKLYQSSSVRDMPVGSYLPMLVDEIVTLFSGSARIKVETLADDFSLGVKALTPLGIIVNELVTNAIKYAFPGDRGGTIRVSASKKGNTVTLVVEDNGAGLPRGFDLAKSSGFGLELVALLARQLGGTIRAERGKGARFVLEFEVGE